MQTSHATTWIQPISLTGQHAKLVPLSITHAEDLKEAAADGKLWELWYTSVPEPDKIEAEIKRRLALQEDAWMVPFAVIDQTTGKAVGMTTYMNIDYSNKRLEIGYTWYRSSVQRSGINTECKLMLLQHAFEDLGCIAVEFRTSLFNRQSRLAIERLGAKLDGILRNHARHANGTLRDTCVYSIIDSEWPTVKASLEHRLKR